MELQWSGRGTLKQDPDSGGLNGPLRSEYCTLRSVVKIFKAANFHGALLALSCEYSDVPILYKKQQIGRCQGRWLGKREVGEQSSLGAEWNCEHQGGTPPEEAKEEYKSA